MSIRDSSCCNKTFHQILVSQSDWLYVHVVVVVRMMTQGTLVCGTVSVYSYTVLTLYQADSRSPPHCSASVSVMVKVDAAE